MLRGFWIANLLLSVLLVCGCGPAGPSNNKGKLEGTRWTSLATRIKGRKLPAGAMEIKFYENGHVDYYTYRGRTVGQYRLAGGDNVVFEFDKEIAGHKKHRERIIVENDQMTMIDSDGTKLKFRLVSRD